jgi:hypothetical protein
LLVLEYVSKSSKRKDYQDNHRKYEQESKVPYYLVFYPETRDLTLFRRNARRYVAVQPDAAERVAIPELELEVGLLDDWVRYWYRGELLPLPTELQTKMDATQLQLKQSLAEKDQALKEKAQALKRAQKAMKREEQERDAKEQAQKREEQERKAKERLLALLRQHGIDPEL